MSRSRSAKKADTLGWLPPAIFIFFAICFALHPQSPLRNGQLLDPDDYMRLNEVINWLRSTHPFGKGWFDLSHPRLDPGEHAIVHWARLVDLPIAFFMLPLLHFMTMRSAALIASFIVPPLLFAVLLFLMPAAARPLIGRGRNNLTAAILIFAPAVTMNFLPGRVDHHGYQIIIAAFGLLCVQRMLLCPGGWRAAIGAAIAYACGLWIGTEALPWLVILCGIAAIGAAWRGGFALRNAAVFGAALPAAVAALMPIAMPHTEFFSRALSWFSGADFIFAILTGLVFVGGWLGGRATGKTWLRLALMAAFGFFAAIAFIRQVPDILTGAYADYDAFFNETLINNIGEAQPLKAALHINPYDPASFKHAFLVFLHGAYLPCLAAVIVLWNLFRAKPRTRLLWLIHAAFLIPALLMTVFWQVRVGWFAEIFSIVPVTWFAWRCWRRIGSRLGGRKQFWAEIGVFFLILPLPMLLLPAAIGNARFYPDLLLFPATRAAPACPLLQASAFLNDRYGDHPHMILSGTNEGPELLFRTKHNVLAAPYNVEGNRMAYKFFNARTDRQALSVLRARHVDLVLVCQNFSLFYAGLDSAKARMRAHIYMDSRGLLHLTSSKERPTMIEQLVNGDIPDWLTPVEIPMDRNYLLFEVNWIKGGLP